VISTFQIELSIATLFHVFETQPAFEDDISISRMDVNEVSPLHKSRGVRYDMILNSRASSEGNSGGSISTVNRVGGRVVSVAALVVLPSIQYESDCFFSLRM